MESAPAGAATVPFHGVHQAGIATQQDRLHFAAFDVADGVRDGPPGADAAVVGRRCEHDGRPAGRPAGPHDADALAPPEDTGEALGLTPGRLTVTFGFGPSLFDGRFGLASRRPAALRDLPPLPGDELDPRRTGGDLCVQACADDPQVAFHAIRNLARPESNGGIRLLRRGYSFTDGLDDRLGQLDAGLFFISFQRDPAGFVAVQCRLGAGDKLNEHVKHVGSRVWAVPPGPARGGWVGETLLGDARA